VIRVLAPDEPMPGTPARPMAGAQAVDPQAIAVEAAAVINRSMERLIRALPGQYLWGYHRYKGPRTTGSASASASAAGDAA
jgi:KDO2-lipid IV(A) lauroyltransferase